jgi:hypothetical protein
VPRRKWIKLWTQETLYRSISQELAPEERWVWIAFLCLAGDSVEPGVIMAAPDIAWTQDQLAQIVKVPLTVMQSAFQKMIDAQKIEVNHGGIIYIKNWEKYQTNWDRIRKYPSQSPKDKPTTEPTTSPTPDKPTTEPTKNHTTEEKRGEGRGGGSSLIVPLSVISNAKDVDTPPDGGVPKTKRQKKKVTDPRVKQILDEITTYLGYPDKTDKVPIPNYPAEGKHIKTILSRHFTAEEILVYWKQRIDSAGGQYVAAHYINQDIGKTKRTSPARRLPTTEELKKSWLGGKK